MMAGPSEDELIELAFLRTTLSVLSGVKHKPGALIRKLHRRGLNTFVLEAC